MRIGLALLAVITSLLPAGGSYAEPPAGFTRAGLEGLPTRDVAERLLGRARAAAVESHQVDPPLFPGGPLGLIRFFGRPIPMNDGMCRREVDWVSFERIDRPASEEEVARDVPARVSSLGRGDQIALAANCRLSAGQRFADLRSTTTLDQAADLLRSLRDARAAAASARPLPFRLICRDAFRRDACRGDGRAALAELPLDLVFLVDSTQGRLTVGRGLYWEIRLQHIGTERATVSMTWQPPAPF